MARLLIQPEETTGVRPLSVSSLINQNNLEASRNVNKPILEAKSTDNPLTAGIKSITNVPSSTFNLLKGLGHAIIHPFNTIKGIGQLAVGGASELGRVLGTGANVGKPTTEEENAFNSFKQLISDRYGSLEKAQKTATEDPVGFGTDVLTLIQGGGALLGKTELLNSYISKVGGPGARVIETTANKTGIPAKIASATEKVRNFNPFAPFKKSFKPEVNNLFETEGITPPVSAITDSNAIKGAEAVASKGLFGQKVAEVASKAIEEVQKRVNEIVERITPKKAISDEALGKIIQEGLKEHEDKFKLTQGKIYDEFSKTYGESNVYGKNTKDALSTLVEEQKKDFLGPDAVDSRLEGALNRITGANNPELKALQKTIDEARAAKANPETMQKLEEEFSTKQAELDKSLTFDELKATRTHVGELLTKNPENSSLKRLYGAITKDMETAIGDIVKNDPLVDDAAKVAKASLDKLNQSFATGKAKIQSNIAQSISKSHLESIAKNLIKRNSAETLRQVKEMIGEERFYEVQKSFLRNIFDESVTRDKFDIGKLKKKLGEYDQATLDELMTPEQQASIRESVSQLEKYDSMSEALKAGKKMAEGSQTAFVGKISALLTAVGSGAFKLASGIILGDFALNRLFSSSLGRKILTEGLNPPNLKALNSLKDFSKANKLLLLELGRNIQK